ncbi:MAG TPA: protein kinase [Capillimicrobium sp.]|nr:protein kinase [Capillimicrobium sp.]
MTTPVGTLLSDRYRLEARIGHGGMSTVYRALDTVLERPVAIKLMHREIASDSDQLERFRREARSVAQLNHPHVVTVIDAGEDDGTPYIVLEYVEGETLKDRIRRFGRLPIVEAIAYAIEIARALGAAHERGIVHRDIKPQNVLVDQEGSAKVTDFGIARSLEEEGLTADGRVLGTTDYVSPEQALGHAVTGQSDLYSLGIVLYEMLTGDVPFKGENQVAVAMKHVREELPDVRVQRPEVSAALAAVLDRATDKDLDRRYLDAGSLAADLEDVLAIETSRAGHVTGEATAVLRTLPGETRRRLPIRMRVPRVVVALALVLAAAAVVAAILLARDNAERGTKPPNVKPATPDLSVVQLRSNAATAFDPFGDQTEHDLEASAAIDDDSASTWSTETYEAGVLNKEGVGLYVDASPGIAARAMELRSPTPGWSGAIYAAEDGPPEDGLDGWTKVATLADVKRSQQVPLDTAGTKFKYYLVWITSLPDDGVVEISDLALLK